VGQGSVAAYLLATRQPGWKAKEHAEAIGKSASRVGDYVLYGEALLKHGLDAERFAALKRAASGGHRARIKALIAQDTLDLAEFDALMVEAIGEEKAKAEARAEAKVLSAARKMVTAEDAERAEKAAQPVTAERVTASLNTVKGLLARATEEGLVLDGEDRAKIDAVCAEIGLALAGITVPAEDTATV
jgi:hypothetical protein